MRGLPSLPAFAGLGGVAGLTGLAGIALGGCGSGSAGLAPAAEPAKSPPLRAQPAGRVSVVGHDPEGLVADPVTGLLAVGLHKPDQLALVDAAQGKVVRRVALPASPRHLALEKPGGPVLVPAETADRLVTVGLPSGRQSSAPVGRHPHDVAFADGRSFVTDEFGDTLTVLRGADLLATQPTPIQPGGIAALDGDVAVVAVRQRVLQTYDARTLRPLARVPAGVGPTHVVAGGGKLFVADTQGGKILSFALHGGKPRLSDRTAAPGSPYGIAIDRRRKRLWVTLTATNRAVQYRLRPGRLVRVASYPTVRQPNSISVDPRSGDAFVSGRSDGVLERIGVGRP